MIREDTSTIVLRPDLAAVAELIAPQEKVLDLGCGDGVLLRYLINTRQVTARGIELSETGVMACVQRGLSVRQGDLHEGLGDYPNASFDTVILSYTIPYLNDPGFVLQEMLRVGRRAIVSFPNWGYWRYRMTLLVSGCMPEVSLNGDHGQGALSGPAAPGRLARKAAPRARPLTIADFLRFCEQQNIQIRERIYLQGGRRLKTTMAAGMRATSAAFVLGFTGL